MVEYRNCLYLALKKYKYEGEIASIVSKGEIVFLSLLYSHYSDTHGPRNSQYTFASKTTNCFNLLI